MVPQAPAVRLVCRPPEKCGAALRTRCFPSATAPTFCSTSLSKPRPHTDLLLAFRHWQSCGFTRRKGTASMRSLARCNFRLGQHGFDRLPPCDGYASPKTILPQQNHPASCRVAYIDAHPSPSRQLQLFDDEMRLIFSSASIAQFYDAGTRGNEIFFSQSTPVHGPVYQPGTQ